jgi:hypothetical protein
LSRKANRGKDSKIAPHGVLVARAALQIPLKVGLHVENLPDVAHRERLGLIDRQGLRCADSVLDLPPVELVSCELIVVLLAEGHQVNLLENPYTLDEDLEDGLLGSVVEIVVPKGDVDA